MKTNYELIVVGGGFAGVAAAISAAKNGVDVTDRKVQLPWRCSEQCSCNAVYALLDHYAGNIGETISLRKYIFGNCP